MDRLVVCVDTDRDFASKLADVARDAGWEARALTSFEDARAEVGAAYPALVVAALKLGTFNGIHLAYFARRAHAGSHVIVYGKDIALDLVHEIHRACAFYERQEGLLLAFPRYLAAEHLPANDRRHPKGTDRRLTFRGGRRATDTEALYRSPTAS